MRGGLYFHDTIANEIALSDIYICIYVYIYIYIPDKAISFASISLK
jgi:hypothetical protein